MKTIIAGFSQFRSHPLRTFLTLLGMVFGVGSVVAMVSIGEGAQRKILSSIESMGSRSTHVKARPVAKERVGDVVNTSVGLSRQDAQAIGDALGKDVEIGWRARIPVSITSLIAPLHTTPFLGVSPNLMSVHSLDISEGRALLPIDHVRGRRVAVLGAQLAERAFPGGAIGQVFRLDYAWFEVVGVLAPRGQSGGDLPIDPAIYDDAVIIPLTTAHEELVPAPAYGELELMTVKVGSIAETVQTKARLLSLFSHLHNGENDIDIIAPEEVLREKESTQRVLNLVLICIAAISLLVGGIGVMNIMLANIMERVSEIGLRRAIGARQKDIRNQFLTEAIVICCVGGIIGVALGYATAFAVAYFAGYPAAFAWVSVFVAFGLSTVVGVIFGYMPARRAALINPIEALHND